MENTENIQSKLVGRRYADACLSQFRSDSALQDQVRSFMEKKRNIMLLMGGPGTGKTYLCAALLPWAAKTFPSVRYYNESNLLIKLRKAIEREGDPFLEIQHLLDDHFIIVDDIGSNNLNDWRKDNIQHIVEYRYTLQLPTIFTTNLSERELRSNLHPRIASRLFDKGNIVVDMFNEPDRRR